MKNILGIGTIPFIKKNLEDISPLFCTSGDVCRLLCSNTMTDQHIAWLQEKYIEAKLAANQF